MVCIFLGAGFSILGRVPLASQLFTSQPVVDVISRQRLLERVLNGWADWQARHIDSAPEQYLAALRERGGPAWRDATWYVALVIALSMGQVRLVGMKPTITSHTLNRTTRISAHEEFWTFIFRRVTTVSVLTTNYDILAERGLRPKPRPRVPRPGFHYGDGPELLKGGGYPSYTHIHKKQAEGTVPIFKLRGSVSWAPGQKGLIHYHDCRPAIRGDTAIVAPAAEKTIPALFRPIWEKAGAALASSDKWVILGYSFPEYDNAINELFMSSAGHRPRVRNERPLHAVTTVSALITSLDVAAITCRPDLAA
jgi:hypothetical protein